MADQSVEARQTRKGLILGLDLGGTKILAGVVNSYNKVLGRAKRATPFASSERILTGEIIGCAEDALRAANITPKDPVTLGLTTQRELDAAVAKAAKAAGAPAPVDTRFEGDRDALIEQLRREREQHARDAEAALAEAGDEALRDEIVPGIRDPFKNTPVE